MKGPAGYHHSQLHAAGTGNHKYLPPFYSRRDKDGRMVLNEELDVPRNPIVLRALNQARKVLNALVRIVAIRGERGSYNVLREGQSGLPGECVASRRQQQTSIS